MQTQKTYIGDVLLSAPKTYKPWQMADYYMVSSEKQSRFGIYTEPQVIGFKQDILLNKVSAKQK